MPKLLAKGEVPTHVFSVFFDLPLEGGAGEWTIEARPILEAGDSWIVVGYSDAPGIVKLDRMELDLDGKTVAGDRLFYATRSLAQRFIDRWGEKS